MSLKEFRAVLAIEWVSHDVVMLACSLGDDWETLGWLTTSEIAEAMFYDSNGKVEEFEGCVLEWVGTPTPYQDPQYGHECLSMKGTLKLITRASDLTKERKET